MSSCNLVFAQGVVLHQNSAGIFVNDVTNGNLHRVVSILGNVEQNFTRTTSSALAEVPNPDHGTPLSIVCFKTKHSQSISLLNAETGIPVWVAEIPSAEGAPTTTQQRETGKKSNRVEAGASASADLACFPCGQESGYAVIVRQNGRHALYCKSSKRHVEMCPTKFDFEHPIISWNIDDVANESSRKGKGLHHSSERAAANVRALAVNHGVAALLIQNEQSFLVRRVELNIKLETYASMQDVAISLHSCFQSSFVKMCINEEGSLVAILHDTPEHGRVVVTIVSLEDGATVSTWVLPLTSGSSASSSWGAFRFITSNTVAVSGRIPDDAISSTSGNQKHQGTVGCLCFCARKATSFVTLPLATGDEEPSRKTPARKKQSQQTLASSELSLGVPIVKRFEGSQSVLNFCLEELDESSGVLRVAAELADGVIGVSSFRSSCHDGEFLAEALDCDTATWNVLKREPVAPTTICDYPSASISMTSRQETTIVRLTTSHKEHRQRSRTALSQNSQLLAALFRRSPQCFTTFCSSECSPIWNPTQLRCAATVVGAATISRRVHKALSAMGTVAEGGLTKEFLELLTSDCALLSIAIDLDDSIGLGLDRNRLVPYSSFLRRLRLLALPVISGASRMSMYGAMHGQTLPATDTLAFSSHTTFDKAVDMRTVLAAAKAELPDGAAGMKLGFQACTEAAKAAASRMVTGATVLDNYETNALNMKHR